MLFRHRRYRNRDSSQRLPTAAGPSVGQRKVYNTVNKLFALSKHEPVAIMVYGNALIAGLPAETVIKQFRMRLGSRSFPTVDGYVEALAEFLAREPLCSPENERDLLVGSVGAVYAAVARALEERLENASVSEQELPSILDEVLSRFHETLTSRSFLEGFDEAGLRALWPVVAAAAEVAMDAILGPLVADADRRQRAIEVGVLACVKEQEASPWTGLVVAGFGRDEYRPVAVPLKFWGHLNHRPRLAREPAIRSTPENPAAVRPFAQSEMVRTFMEGVDPGTRWLFRETVRRALVEVLPRSLQDALGQAPSAEAEQGFAELGARLAQELEGVMDAHRHAQHIRPVIEAVTHLGKEDLAAMAEALVQLTSLKRRFTLAPETVGGPIDVAVVSKHDGFIWMRRKHYFQAELNPQFMHRYFRDAGNGAPQEGTR